MEAMGTQAFPLVTGFVTVLALTSCGHTPPDLSESNLHKSLHSADKIVVVHAESPTPYVTPRPTLGEMFIDAAPLPYFAASALLFTTGVGLHAAELSQGKPEPPQQVRQVPLTASLDLVSSAALSRYRGRVVTYEHEISLFALQPKALDRYIGDLRAKQFPTEPIVVFQVARWGVDRGVFRRFQLYYRALASIYIADNPKPVWESDCIGTPTAPPLDSLTAEREAYLLDGGVLLNLQTRLAARRCGEILAIDFPSP